MSPQGSLKRVRTANLHPTDVIKRELTGDDSDLESDWYDRTGKPLFHAKEPKVTPKRTHVLITIGKGANAIKRDLPAAYAVDPTLRTEDQKLSATGQENFNQNGIL